MKKAAPSILKNSTTPKRAAAPAPPPAAAAAAFDVLVPRAAGAASEANPEEIEFAYCIGARCSVTAELRNTGTQSLCYKIQTSNPSRYAVTPAVSTVDPGETVPVAITCAAMTDPPAAGARQDRFQVKAAVLKPTDEVLDEAAFWKSPPPSDQITLWKFGALLPSPLSPLAFQRLFSSAVLGHFRARFSYG